MNLEEAIAIRTRQLNGKPVDAALLERAIAVIQSGGMTAGERRLVRFSEKREIAAEDVLGLLGPQWITGRVLAASLRVGTETIKAAIGVLVSAGHSIQGVRGKGYRLVPKPPVDVGKVTDAAWAAQKKEPSWRS